MKRTKLFALLALILFPFFTSCGDGETITYQPYTMNITTGEVALLPEVKTYISEKLKEFGANEMVGNFSEDQAIYKADAFMNKLVKGIKDENFRVFEGSQITSHLFDVMSKEVHDKTVSIAANGEPARHIMQIVIVEGTPAGNTPKATEFIEGLFGGYEFVKTSTEVDGTSDVINKYVYQQLFDSEEEMIAAYDGGAWARGFMASLEDSWPSDVIYTSKFTIDQLYLSEITGTKGSYDNELLKQNPSLATKTVWSTTDASAPFQMMEVVGAVPTTAPVYACFKVNLDGETNDYRVYQKGYFITINDAKDKMIYGFSFQSNSTFQLINKDGEAVENGAIYTCE